MSERLHFDAIRDFMDIPREGSATTELAWHNDSPRLIIPQNNEMFLGSVARGVEYLMTTYPYDDLHTTLLDSVSGGDKRTRKDLRFQRKVLMIARDAIRLTTTMKSDDEPLEALTELTRSIGGIVDDNADTLRLVERSLDLSLDVQAAAQDLILQPISVRKVAKRARKVLMTEQLTGRSGELATMSEADFHRARRMFRSVVHLGIVSQILYPDEHKAQFVMDGIELSARYGEVHDRMLHTPATPHQSATVR